MPDHASPAAEPLFALHSGVVGTTRVVACTGELDLDVAWSARDAVGAAVAARPECVVLDLSGLTFLDASGITLMIRAHRQARRHGVRLAIVRAPEAVHHVVRTCGLDDALPFTLAGEQVAA